MLIDQHGVPIVYREPFEFNGPCWVDERRPGETILEMVRSVPNLPDLFMTRGVVCINGEVVPREMWAYVRPKPTRAELPIAVTMHWPLGGGGRSTLKTIVGIVAALALIVVTAGIAGGALGVAGPIFGGAFLFGAGSTSAALLAGAVGIAGALAISALTAPPTTQDVGGSAQAALGGGETLNSDNKEAAGASGNVIDPGGAIPRVIGTRKVFPPFACEPVVELVDQDEYVEAVFILNGPHLIEDIRIDGALITDAEDVEFETREGWDSDTALTLVARQGRTLVPNLTLSEHVTTDDGHTLKHQSSPSTDLPVWHSFVARPYPDEIWIHLFLPGGLTNTTGSAGQIASLPFRVRMRRRGTVSWINLPEFHLGDQSAKQLRRAIIIKWDTAPAIPSVPTASGWVGAFVSVPTQDQVPGGDSPQWTAHSYFDDGSGSIALVSGTEASSRVRNVALYDNRVEVFLDENTFERGIYEFEIKRGYTFVWNALTPATYVNGGVILNYFWYFTSAGSNQILAQTGASSRTQLIRVVSIWNEPPITTPGSFAAIALKAQNRNVQRVSCSASGYVLDTIGSPDNWNTYTTTSNPAPHYRDVLGGSLNLFPLDSDLIDDASLFAWRTLCATNDWTCDSIINDMRTQDVLGLIASCGYARPYQSDIYGVIVDNDRSLNVPTQVFSRVNANNVRYERAFVQPPEAFVITYRSEAEDDDRAQIIVYQQDPSIAQEGNFESISYDGIVEENKVDARGRFDLDQANLRSTFYYLDTDVEALVCRRGDLVALQHDILTSRCGDGHIVRKTLSAGNIAGVVLDSKITIVGGNTGIAIRRTDGTISTHALSNIGGETETLTLTTPFADTGTILGFDDTSREYGSLVVAGALATEYLRMLVHTITPTKDLGATVTLIDEAPGLVRYNVANYAANAVRTHYRGIGNLRAGTTQRQQIQARLPGTGNMSNNVRFPVLPNELLSTFSGASTLRAPTQHKLTTSASYAGASTFSAQAPQQVSLSFLGTTFASGPATQVSANIDLGTSGNLVIVISGSSFASTLGVTTISIAGNTGATQQILAQRTNRGMTGIYTLSGAATGLQTVTITFNASFAFGAFTIYSISGHSSMTPASTASDTTSNSAVAATLNVPANGGVVGSLVGTGVGADLTSAAWTSLTEDVDSKAVPSGPSDRLYSTAHASQQPANASYNGGATLTGTGTINCTGAWAVWSAAT